MNGDYALGQDEEDGKLEASDENDDWADRFKKKAKKGKRGDSKVKKVKEEKETAPVEQIANKLGQAKEETMDIDNAKQVDSEDMEIVDTSGNVEVMRRIDIGKESARFALLVLPAVSPTPTRSLSSPHICMLNFPGRAGSS
jgi:hypothetical protein